MAFVEPVTLRSRGIALVPLSLDHEEGLRAAAADGELWKLRVTSVPEPERHARLHRERAADARGRQPLRLRGDRRSQRHGARLAPATTTSCPR